LSGVQISSTVSVKGKLSQEIIKFPLFFNLMRCDAIMGCQQQRNATHLFCEHVPQELVQKMLSVEQRHKHSRQLVLWRNK